MTERPSGSASDKEDLQAFKGYEPRYARNRTNNWK